VKNAPGRLLTALPFMVLVAACSTSRPAVISAPSPRPIRPSPSPTAAPATAVGTHPEPLPVEKARGEVIVAAWSEPRQMAPGGGQAQIVVRLQQRGGAPYPGVEVRIAVDQGALYSQGRVLVTDANGMTRDRLTTASTARITVNAGGTVYRFDVPVSGS
jgi:hypothetical protein